MILFYKPNQNWLISKLNKSPYLKNLTCSTWSNHRTDQENQINLLKLNTPNHSIYEKKKEHIIGIIWVYEWGKIVWAFKIHNKEKWVSVETNRSVNFRWDIVKRPFSTLGTKPWYQTNKLTHTQQIHNHTHSSLHFVLGSPLSMAPCGVIVNCLIDTCVCLIRNKENEERKKMGMKIKYHWYNNGIRPWI